MEIRLRTLTPLWTGGVDGTCDRLHETGIIGSLRWWYEAIVRGLGGSACDPTSHTCTFDKERHTKAKRQGKSERDSLYDAGLCDVCQVFGTTGWKRRFHMKVVDDRTRFAWDSPDTLNVRPPDRNRGWYLLPGRVGTFNLQVSGDAQTLRILASLLLFLERWGNLGAKPQLGYGVFALSNRDQVKAYAKHQEWEVMGTEGPSAKPELPDLRRFGFIRYRFQPRSANWWTKVPGMERLLGSRNMASALQRVAKGAGESPPAVPLTPSLKNEWRFHRWKGSRDDEMRMFGTLRWKQQGDEGVSLRSKIGLSWAYPSNDSWEVRGWAWLQKAHSAADVWTLLQDEGGWQQVIGVQGTLESKPKGPWREWNTQEVAAFLEEIQ